jgi:hypothetical protein
MPPVGEQADGDISDGQEKTRQSVSDVKTGVEMDKKGYQTG